jgi:hypothetical protein
MFAALGTEFSMEWPFNTRGIETKTAASAARLVAHPDVRSVRIFLVMNDQQALTIEPISGLNLASGGYPRDVAPRVPIAAYKRSWAPSVGCDLVPRCYASSDILALSKFTVRKATFKLQQPHRRLDRGERLPCTYQQSQGRRFSPVHPLVHGV